MVDIDHQVDFECDYDLEYLNVLGDVEDSVLNICKKVKKNEKVIKNYLFEKDE